MACHARADASEATSYNVGAPVYPATYTEAQKNAQRDAGRAVVKEINAAIAAGAKGFTVPPGVYRLPAKGPDHEIKLWKVNGFALQLATPSGSWRTAADSSSHRSARTSRFSARSSSTRTRSAFPRGRSWLTTTTPA
jgi:hypothetical protein